MKPSILTSIELAILKSLLLLPSAWRQLKGVLGKSPVKLTETLQDDNVALAEDAQKIINLSQFMPRFEKLSPNLARLQFHFISRKMMRKAAPGIASSHRKLDTDKHSIDYIYLEPENTTHTTPLILYFHGGGWVIGKHDSLDRELTWLAHKSQMRVASFDYRLAPEFPFPAAFEDITAIYQAGEQQKICEKCPLIVAGDSAGANLAILLSIARAKAGLSLPAAQLLIYPVTDLRMLSQSHQKFADGYLLTHNLMRWFVNHYLGDPRLAADPSVSPLLVSELRKKQPPTLIATAGYDILHDEGSEFARRLTASGTFVKHRNYANLLHGFLSLTGMIPEAAQACDQLYQDLRDLLAANQN